MQDKPVCPYAGPVWVVPGLLLLWLPFMGAAAMKPLLDRYYLERYGNVSGSLAPVHSGPIVVAVVVAGALIDLFTFGSGAPSATAIGAALAYMGIAARDRPWRAHQLAAAAIMAAVAVMTAMPGCQVKRAEQILPLVLPPFLVSQALAAYLDHRLLAKMLRPRRVPEPEDDAFAAREELES